MTRRSANPPRPATDPVHPSYLELDRFVLGAPGALATAAHVGACDRCRRHVETLREAPPVPAGLRDRLASPASDPSLPGASSLVGARRWPGWFRGPRVAALGLAGALAAGALVWIAREPRAPVVGYDGVKGLPSVWIYVKRDNDLALWDGERPLEARDRLRLKIDPQDLTHIDVFTRDEASGGALAAIFDGRLQPGTVTTLPGAWQLDGDSPRESLIVVLSRDGVSPGTAQRFLRDGAPAGVWLRRFELHRSAARPPERAP
jgi:hypothetical protein